MNKLLRGIHTSRIPRNRSIEEWNALVRSKFGRFVRRKSILTRDREILRTELMNLQKIEGNQECVKLLHDLVGLYREGLTTDRHGALQQMIVLFPGTGAADENWLSLFMRAEWPPTASLQDVVQAQFDWLDVVLEGCHKHHFCMFYVFAIHRHNGTFPADITAHDYGALVAGLPQASSARFRFLCEDPEHHIPVNQWRNIAAHKTFAIRSSRTLDVAYGRPPNQTTVRITIASLRRILAWAIKALNTLRLATVILYLEYMKELQSAGLSEPTLRLDSLLTHLCHNLRLVGFFCVSYRMTRRDFVIDLLDVRGRPTRDAIIHASQVLDQMSIAVRSDPAVRPSPDRVEVRLVREDGRVNVQASVNISDAIAYSDGKLTMKQYVACVDFQICEG
jgi:hypothetical protein